METPKSYSLTITYTDGSHEHFILPSQVEKTKLASLIEKLLSSSVLSLELEEGSLLVIPTVNIRSAELSPAPEKLPEVVLHHVQRRRRVP
jgi:hypothetical protein